MARSRQIQNRLKRFNYYRQIAKQYKTVILSDIPQLSAGEEGPARRFLNLVDEFYDQHVYLLLSSEVSLDQMYQGELLSFEFKRALSRLDEIRSRSYWEDY
jgi:cell division protein ZapE